MKVPQADRKFKKLKLSARGKALIEASITTQRARAAKLELPADSVSEVETSKPGLGYQATQSESEKENEGSNEEKEKDEEGENFCLLHLISIIKLAGAPYEEHQQGVRLQIFKRIMFYAIKG